MVVSQQSAESFPAALDGTHGVPDSIARFEAQPELRDPQERLDPLQRDHPIGEKGFTKAGIRKLIARLHEELAVYEGSEEARS